MRSRHKGSTNQIFGDSYTHRRKCEVLKAFWKKKETPTAREKMEHLEKEKLKS